MRKKLTPEQRTVRARLAAHASWARTADRRARTAPARNAALARIDAHVRDATLSPEEQSRRITSARRAHFLRLALASSRARRRGTITE